MSRRPSRSALAPLERALLPCRGAARPGRRARRSAAASRRRPTPPDRPPPATPATGWPPGSRPTATSPMPRRPVARRHPADLAVPGHRRRRAGHVRPHRHLVGRPRRRRDRHRRRPSMPARSATCCSWSMRPAATPRLRRRRPGEPAGRHARRRSSPASTAPAIRPSTASFRQGVAILGLKAAGATPPSAATAWLVDPAVRHVRPDDPRRLGVLPPRRRRLHRGQHRDLQRRRHQQHGHGHRRRSPPPGSTPTFARSPGSMPPRTPLAAGATSRASPTIRTPTPLVIQAITALGASATRRRSCGGGDPLTSLLGFQHRRAGRSPSRAPTGPNVIATEQAMWGAMPGRSRSAR